jgi:hypothetical protein
VRTSIIGPTRSRNNKISLDVGLLIAGAKERCELESRSTIWNVIRFYFVPDHKILMLVSIFCAGEVIHLLSHAKSDLSGGLGYFIT